MAESLSLPVGRKNGGFVVHSLRHFFRSFCTNKGIPERVIDLWQGHVGTRTTGAIYYHLTAAESQEFMRKVPFDETISNPDQRGSENEN